MKCQKNVCHNFPKPKLGTLSLWCLVCMSSPRQTPISYVDTVIVDFIEIYGTLVFSRLLWSRWLQPGWPVRWWTVLYRYTEVQVCPETSHWHRCKCLCLPPQMIVSIKSISILMPVLPHSSSGMHMRGLFASPMGLMRCTSPPSLI